MNTDIPGDLIVSEEVLADIAGHAALQCYGVVGMAQPAAANGRANSCEGVLCFLWSVYW